MTIRNIILIALFIISSAMAYADTIYLKDGRVVEGEVTKETDEAIVVKKSMGSSGDAILSYKKESVKRIEKGPVQIISDGNVKGIRQNVPDVANQDRNSEKDGQRSKTRMTIRNVGVDEYGMPTGYGTIQFGMTKEEIEKNIQEEGGSTTYSDGSIITVEKLFDVPAAIMYFLTPSTKKCYMIYVILPDSIDYNRIEKPLIDKYGEPASSSYSPYRTTVWERGNISIGLMDGKRINYPNKKIVVYMDINLDITMMEERKALDKKSVDKF